MNQEGYTNYPRLYPKDFETVIRQIGAVLEKKKSFLICGHVRPDGDCIGSQLSLYSLLKDMNKTVRMYNPGPIMEYFLFAPGIEHLETSFDKNYTCDVCVFLDCGSLERVIENIRPCGLIINIDHHKSNEEFGDINYIDPNASAVGEQLYHIITVMEKPITRDMANCMYLSLLSDTGGFRYTNTKSLTFEVTGELVKAGADPTAIAEHLFENKSPISIWLKAQVLGNLKYECGGRLVWGEITQEMYRAVGEENEPEGLVGEMRGIAGVEVSILIHEIEEGGMRVGLRSRGEVDVSRIASEMGGGGHTNASGCYIRGDYTALKSQILSLARRMMEGK